MLNLGPFPVVSLKIKNGKKKISSPDPRNNPFNLIQLFQDSNYNSLLPRESKLPRLRAISPSFDFKNKQSKKHQRVLVYPSRVVSLQLFSKDHLKSQRKKTPTFCEHRQELGDKLK
jgi:hypothetical protein